MVAQTVVVEEQHMAVVELFVVEQTVVVVFVVDNHIILVPQFVLELFVVEQIVDVLGEEVPANSSF